MPNRRQRLADAAFKRQQARFDARRKEATQKRLATLPVARMSDSEIQTAMEGIFGEGVRVNIRRDGLASGAEVSAETVLEDIDETEARLLPPKEPDDSGGFVQ